MNASGEWNESKKEFFLHSFLSADNFCARVSRSSSLLLRGLLMLSLDYNKRNKKEQILRNNKYTKIDTTQDVDDI